MPQYATSPPRSERAELPQRPDVRQPDAVAAGSQLDERQAALLVELVVESWNYYDVTFGIADRFYDGKINVMNTKEEGCSMTLQEYMKPPCGKYLNAERY